MFPWLVEGGCLYYTLGGSTPVEAVRAFNVLYMTWCC
jgi:hypothetical protein